MINDIYNSLTTEQRRCLVVAFEEGVTYVIEYKPGHYIGVNVPQNPDFQSQEEINKWSIGLLNKSKKS